MKSESTGRLGLPEEPIDRLLGPLARFMHVEASGGLVLLACTAVALALANSPLSSAYLHFWETEVGVELGAFRVRASLEHWINDGLMALFFFVIGLEVKREIVLGELRDPQRATLPIVAAVGGMVAPAGIYLTLQAGGPAARGWGIPMATDIAFVVGCMAVLGSRIPHGLRIMLLSLAIADDIGAILVIAVGYSAGINVTALIAGLLGIGIVAALARIGVRSFGVYTLAGLLVWFAFHESGVHATVAGVILGLLTPARPYLGEGTAVQLLERAREVLQGGRGMEESDPATRVRAAQWAARETISPLGYLEHALHPWVAFVIMPVFALANAGVPLRLASLTDRVALAIGVSLLLGKPLGIILFSWAAIRLGAARLPEGVGWMAIAGGGALAGIGFTMALFVAGLALDGAALESAKVGILGASAVAAVAGMTLLVRAFPSRVSTFGS